MNLNEYLEMREDQATRVLEEHDGQLVEVQHPIQAGLKNLFIALWASQYTEAQLYEAQITKMTKSQNRREKT